MGKRASNKSGAPGADANREAWDKAAKGSGGDSAPKAKGKRGEQMRIKVDSRDAVRVPAEHELHRAMTHAEWEEQSALLAANRVRLMTIEEEIAALKRKHAAEIKTLKASTAQAARQCDAREWLTLVDCIEIHDVNTRTVTVFADVNGDLGAEVIPARKMRDDEYERAVKESPFEPPPPAVPPPPADAPTVDDEEAEP